MNQPAPSDSLDIQNLTAHYRNGNWTPVTVIEEVLRRIEAYADKAVWISLVPRSDLLEAAERATRLLERGGANQLAGVPFAVKDNIDLAGQITTAGCAGFSSRAKRSSTVVAKLVEAGAIPIGKANLDQFATGLVGTRSPYGTPRNPFDARYIPGGSSSGSAVAVACGTVSFALGTDTAGSGRVPAAFNNIVGLKPTRGRLSTAGLVPACRSLDCVSIFALTCADASIVLNVAAGFDAGDDFSLAPDQIPHQASRFPTAFRFGIPDQAHLRFFGNADAEALFRRSVNYLEELGGTAVEIDYEPFVRAGALLYEGPWVAERLASTQKFMEEHPDALLPVTREIIQAGRRFDAVAGFRGMYELQSLRRQAEREWAKMDVMLLPTAGTIYTVAEIESDPIRLNANLGYYTNFVNLLELSAVAVPAGLGREGIPFGVTLMAPAGYESALLHLGDRVHRRAGTKLGATQAAIPAATEIKSLPDEGAMVRLAVVGAHLSGQPLNHQMIALDARLVRTCRTAPCYLFYALPGTKPPKPGLVRTDAGDGGSIELEVWELSDDAFGRFVAAIPPPLGIGAIELEDKELVKGFLCESYATHGAKDITRFGGWRAFLNSGTT